MFLLRHIPVHGCSWKSVVVDSGGSLVVSCAQPAGLGTLPGDPGLVALVGSLPLAEGGIIRVIRVVLAHYNVEKKIS